MMVFFLSSHSKLATPKNSRSAEGILRCSWLVFQSLLNPVLDKAKARGSFAVGRLVEDWLNGKLALLPFPHPVLFWWAFRCCA